MYTLKLKSRCSYAKFDKKYGLSTYPAAKNSNLREIQERLQKDEQNLKAIKAPQAEKVKESNFTRFMYFLNL